MFELLGGNEGEGESERMTLDTAIPFIGAIN